MCVDTNLQITIPGPFGCHKFIQVGDDKAVAVFPRSKAVELKLKPARIFFRRSIAELTEHATSPEDADLGKFKSAVSIGKEAFPAVRARSLHLEEGPGDAVGAGVAKAAGVVNVAAAAAPAKGAGHQAVRPVPDGTGPVRLAGRCGYLG